ncbi:MAG: hypothetical protein WA755_02925, partial [Candidatus Acidiferrales bacterium]
MLQRAGHGAGGLNSPLPPERRWKCGGLSRVRRDRCAVGGFDSPRRPIRSDVGGRDSAVPQGRP